MKESIKSITLFCDKCGEAYEAKDNMTAFSPFCGCPQTIINFESSDLVVSLRQQLTEAKERDEMLVDMLNLLDVDPENWFNGCSRLIENLERAEKAEQGRDDWKRLAEERGEALISVTETLKECNSVLPTYADLEQENKRLLAVVEAAGNYVCSLSDNDMRLLITAIDEQALKESNDE